MSLAAHSVAAVDSEQGEDAHPSDVCLLGKGGTKLEETSNTTAGRRPHKRRAEYGLANSGVSPGYDKAGAHGPNRSSSKCSASIISLTSSILVFKVNAMRKRAVPSGTVGGLMARMS